MSNWYEKDPARFAVEMELWERHYPHAVVTRQGQSLDVNLCFVGEQDSYLVQLSYPKRFPFSSMDARIEQPRLKSGTPHRYFNGNLCLFHYGETGPQTTGVIYAKYTEKYIENYEHWLATGKWRDA